MRRVDLEIVQQLVAKASANLLVVEPNIDALPALLAGRSNVALTSAVEALAKANVVVFLVNHRAFAAIDAGQLQGRAVVNTCGWRQ